MTRDERLVMLRPVLGEESFSTDAALASGVRQCYLVDPFHEDGGIMPIEQKLGVLTPNDLPGQGPLGYAWFAHKAPWWGRPLPLLPGFLGHRPKVGSGSGALAYKVDSRFGRLHRVVVTGPTTTHTIDLNMDAGGAIHGWRVEIPGSGVDAQIVNHGTSSSRGVQAGFEWVDAETGEFVRHLAVQGGNRFSIDGVAPELQLGGIFTHLDQSGSGIEFEINTVFAPAEFDPDGFHSIPGCSSSHGGRVDRPIMWRDIKCSQQLVVNYRGEENVHRLRTTWDIPFDIESPPFDMHLYHRFCVEGAVGANLRAYDADLDAEFLISNGIIGANYQADGRRYAAHGNRTWGDEEGPITPIGFGHNSGIAATGAIAFQMAVAIAGKLGKEETAIGSMPTMPKFTTGNSYNWLQQRAFANGVSGRNVASLTHGTHLSMRLGGNGDRVCKAGEHTLESFIVTDIWTAVKSKLQGVLT